ncbi:MAG: hypothetical protein Q9M43_05860 [Sulfurimonas sp.]|nr:hypothetical protein [Sulfurimonas sp.]
MYAIIKQELKDDKFYYKIMPVNFLIANGPNISGLEIIGLFMPITYVGLNYKALLY